MPIQLAKAVLLRESSLINWDDAPMMHKGTIEVVDNLLRYHGRHQLRPYLTVEKW